MLSAIHVNATLCARHVHDPNAVDELPVNMMVLYIYILGDKFCLSFASRSRHGETFTASFRPSVHASLDA